MSEKPHVRGMDRVAVIPFVGIDGAFVCLSGRRQPERALYGPGWPPHERSTKDENSPRADYELTEVVVTFTYLDDKAGIAAEWDGAMGPIHLWFRHQPGDEDKPVKHWLWPEAYGDGHWSQLAVEREGLAGSLLDGAYECIFAALKGWVESRKQDEDQTHGR